MEGSDIAFNDFNPTLVYQSKIVHSAIRMYNPYLEEKIITEVDHFIEMISFCKPTNPYHDVMMNLRDKLS